ncbi:MAG: DciA family protein [Nodosilinea sp.]
MPLDSIGQVFQQFERQPRWRSRGQFRQVLNHWPALVGEVVARQAAPVRLDQRILYVAVANPMWSQTLTLERLAILAKINHQLGLDLSDIRFSSGDWYRRATPAGSAPGDLTAPAIPQWVQQHPSFEPLVSPPPPLPPAPTPLASFQQWSTLTQRLAAHQPLCPQCHCPCPSGELQRWQRCSLCAAQGFGQPRANRPL